MTSTVKKKTNNNNNDDDDDGDDDDNVMKVDDAPAGGGGRRRRRRQPRGGGAADRGHRETIARQRKANTRAKRAVALGVPETTKVSTNVAALAAAQPAAAAAAAAAVPDDNSINDHLARARQAAPRQQRASDDAPSAVICQMSTLIWPEKMRLPLSVPNGDFELLMANGSLEKRKYTSADYARDCFVDGDARPLAFERTIDAVRSPAIAVGTQRYYAWRTKGESAILFPACGLFIYSCGDSALLNTPFRTEANEAIPSAKEQTLTAFIAKIAFDVVRSSLEHNADNATPVAANADLLERLAHNAKLRIKDDVDLFDDRNRKASG